MNSANQSAAETGASPASPGHRLWSVFLGIVFILCGTFAFLAPLTSTLAISVVFAASMTIAGIARVLQAFRAAAWKGFFLNLFLGLVYLAASAAFWLSPVLTAITITLMLAWLLLVSGIGEIALGFRVRPERGWFGFVVAGLFSLGAGLWLMFRLPLAGFLVPGVVLGVSLILEGIAFLGHGLTGNASAAPSKPATAR